MNRTFISRHAGTALLAAAGALVPLCPQGAWAGELAAVVSSDSGPYAEAYAAFKDALNGTPADLYNASAPGFAAPDDLVYVAAFGAKAAAQEYPPGIHLVYALAPVSGRGRLWHEISMVPEPSAAIAAYKALQPGLRRLAVFWAAYPGEKYLAELKSAGEAAGVEIIPARIKTQEAFPERLRRLMGKMDAFWLMPDPALITQSSIMVLANFSCANGIPFYAPTAALVASGATASFAPGFAAAGAAAARAVLVIYKGGQLPAITYVDNPELRLNEDLAGKCGWPIKPH